MGTLRESTVGMRFCTYLSLFVVCLMKSAALSADPGWWRSNPGLFNPSASSDNYAAVNQGQLKNFVATAASYLDANFPGGAGDTVHNMVNTWKTNANQFASGTQSSNSPAPNDLALVNVAQLKAVVQPFYDQLNSQGFAIAVPWTDDSSSDSAPVNIGQVKAVFAFDVMVGSSDSTLPDWWSQLYFGQTGINGNDSPWGDGLTYWQMYHQGLSPLNPSGSQSVLQLANTDLSYDPVVGTDQIAVDPIVANVGQFTGSVLFQMAGNSHGLISMDKNTWVKSLALSPDANGQVRVWFKGDSSEGNAFVSVSTGQGAVVAGIVVSNSQTDAFGIPYAWLQGQGISTNGNANDDLKAFGPSDRTPILWLYNRSVASAHQIVPSNSVPDAVVDASGQTPGSFTTLQAAYDAVPSKMSDGVTPNYAIIEVVPGYYGAGVTNTTGKMVFWKADAPAVGGSLVIVRPQGGSAFSVDATTVIDGFTLYGDQATYSGSSGVSLAATGIVRMVNTIIDGEDANAPSDNSAQWTTGWEFGVDTASGGTVVLAHCTLTNSWIVNNPSSLGSIEYINCVLGASTTTSFFGANGFVSTEVLPNNLTTRGGHLTANSTACLQMGASNSGVYVDIFGQPRPTSLHPDLGAEQWVAQPGHTLPLWYEQLAAAAVGIPVSEVDGNADYDGDGLSTAQEFDLSTHPAQIPLVTIIGSSNLTVVSGSSLGPIEANVADAMTGLSMPGAQLMFSSDGSLGGPGAADGSSTGRFSNRSKCDGSGIGSTWFYSWGTTGGNVAMTASSGLGKFLVVANWTIDVTPGPPVYTITLASGSPDQTFCGYPFTETSFDNITHTPVELVAMVTDALGNPVPYVPVTFVGGDFSDDPTNSLFNPVSGVTDSKGQCTTSFWSGLTHCVVEAVTDYAEPAYLHVIDMKPPPVLSPTGPSWELFDALELLPEAPITAHPGEEVSLVLGMLSLGDTWSYYPEGTVNLKYTILAGDCTIAYQSAPNQIGAGLAALDLKMGTTDSVIRIDSQYYPTRDELQGGQNPGPYYSTAYFYINLPKLNIGAFSGNNQSMGAGQIAARPIVAKISTDAGLGSFGKPVTFSVNSGSGGCKVSSDGGTSWHCSATALSDNNGYAEVLFQGGQTPESVTVVANAPTIGSVNFTEVIGSGVDSDSDGMLDWWELANGLNSNDATDALKDADGDRIPNLWEFYAGTDPQDASSTPLPDAIVDGSQPTNATQGRYATLQEAYDALPMYDLNGITPYHGVIQVMQGVYKMGLDGTGVPKNVVWLGDTSGPTVIQCSGTAMALAGDTVIDGFVFRGDSRTLGSAVVAQAGSNNSRSCRVRLVNCIVDCRQGALAGAVVNQGAELWVVQSTIVGCQGGSANAILNLSGTMHLVNSVLSYQSSASTQPSVVVGAGTIVAEHSIIVGMTGAWGTVDADPKLTLSGGHLTVQSTICLSAGGLDAGDLVDIHGQWRSASVAPDIGAEQWVDSNGEGLPDWWQIQYFGGIVQNISLQLSSNGLTNLQEYLDGYNPFDWYNGELPLLSITGGNNQVIYQGQAAPIPLTLQVKEIVGTGNVPWANASVTLSILGGDSLLSLDGGQTWDLGGQATSDQSGNIQILFSAGQTTGVWQVMATAGNVSTTFDEKVQPWPMRLVVTQGANQNLLPNQVSPLSVTVKVLDSGGQQRADVPVTLSAIGAGEVQSYFTSDPNSWSNSLTLSTMYDAWSFRPGSELGPVSLWVTAPGAEPLVIDETILDPNGDDDGDGIPNSWEVQFGLNPNDPADALKDSDADRIPNLWEYARGSNPMDGNSVPTPDAIVDASQITDLSQSPPRFATLQEAYDYVPATVNNDGMTPYFSIIQVVGGVYSAGVDGTVTPKKVLWLANFAGGDMPQGSKADPRDQVVITSSEAAFIVGEETVIDGFLIAGSNVIQAAGLLYKASDTNTSGVGLIVQSSVQNPSPLVRLVNTVICDRCSMASGEGANPLPIPDGQNPVCGVLNNGGQLWIVESTLFGCMRGLKNPISDTPGVLNELPYSSVVNAAGVIYFVDSVAAEFDGSAGNNSSTNIEDYTGGGIYSASSILFGMHGAWSSADANPYLGEFGVETAASTACFYQAATDAGVAWDINGNSRKESTNKGSDIGAHQWTTQQHLSAGGDGGSEGDSGSSPTDPNNGNGNGTGGPGEGNMDPSKGGPSFTNDNTIPTPSFNDSSPPGRIYSLGGGSSQYKGTGTYILASGEDQQSGNYYIPTTGLEGISYSPTSRSPVPGWTSVTQPAYYAVGAGISYQSNDAGEGWGGGWVMLDFPEPGDDIDQVKPGNVWHFMAILADTPTNGGQGKTAYTCGTVTVSFTESGVKFDINADGVLGQSIYSDGSYLHLEPPAPAINTSRTLLFVPTDVVVDYNRDGKLAFDGSDTCSSPQKPFRFWINDDLDDWGNDEKAKEYNIPVGSESSLANWHWNTLFSVRDLEDFVPLTMELPAAIVQLAHDGTAKVGLKWSSVTDGHPHLKLFRSADPNGGSAYLTTHTIARAQVGEQVMLDVENGNIAYFPQSYFAPSDRNITNTAGTDGMESTKAAFGKFIMEGCEKGTGVLSLVVTINGVETDLNFLNVKLMNVLSMYTRHRIRESADQIPDPWDESAPDMSEVEDDVGCPPELDPNADKKTIVFVHGWRMDYAEYLTWSETTYKRLWHLGFKGDFYSFRWPTYSGETAHGLLNTATAIAKPGGLTYNASEYRAWLSLRLLAGYVNGLPNEDSKYIFAHSMGNVVTSGALKVGMKVTKYAMCNAAAAAMAYDGNRYNTNIYKYKANQADFPTPDDATDAQTRKFGYRNQYNPANAQLAMPPVINFYLPDDAALAAWSINNLTCKPNTGLPNKSFYGYDKDEPVGKKLYHVNGSSGNAYWVTSQSEALSYVSRARSAAAGSDGETKGCITKSIGMDRFDFESEHSSEWIYSIQFTFPFWSELLNSFDIRPIITAPEDNPTVPSDPGGGLTIKDPSSGGD